MIVSPFSSQPLDGTVALGFLEGGRGTPLRLERCISASGTVTDTEMEVKDGMARVEVTAGINCQKGQILFAGGK